MKKSVKLLFIPLALLLAAAIAIGVVLAVIGGKEQHTVTFESNGGTQIEPYTLKEGDEIVRPADPAKSLFTFAGWYADSVFTQEFGFPQKMPAHDLTLYARWTPKRSSRIEYNSMGGSAVAPSVGAVGDVFAAPEDPVYQGYRFGGWYRDPECEEPFFFTVYPAESITLYAQWLDDPAYAYIRYFGNGKQMARIPVEKGQTISAPTSEELFGERAAGIVLDGWYSDPSMNNSYSFGTASADLTLYASYYSKGLTMANGIVTGYLGSDANVYVPNRYEGDPISGIGASAFAENDAIVSVDLPDTVVQIGNAAFYRCRHLDRVNLSGSVTAIGKNAFFDCSRLTQYGDITGVSMIPDELFLGCRKLASVTLSPNATSVGKQAFADCEMLTEIVIPDRVTTLGDGLFDGCVALRKVTLPARLSSFGTGVFEGCVALAELTLDPSNTQFKVIDGNLYRGESELLRYAPGEKGEKEFVVPEAVNRIAAGAFDGNSTLESIVVNSDSVSITCGAFSNMKALGSLTVPTLGMDGYLAYYFGRETVQSEGVHSTAIPETLHTVTLLHAPSEIVDYAFYGATGLRVVNGLEAAESVGDGAFAFTSLEKFTVSALLDSIGSLAFEGCRSFEAYVMETSSSVYSVYDGCLYNGEGTVLLSVPAAKTTIAFAPSVTEIAGYSFTDSSVGSVAVPESVTSIGKAAFNNCGALTDLTLSFLGDGTSANNYLAYVFGSSVNITEATDDDGVRYRNIMYEDRYSLSTVLSKVTLTQQLTALPDGAFAGFRGLKEVDLGGAQIERYGAYCFYDTALGAWDLAGATQIGDGAFRLSALESVVIPATVQTIGYGAFSQLRELEHIEFAENGALTEIAPHAFLAYNAVSSLADLNVAFTSRIDEEVVIPATIRKIGANAFYGMGLMYNGSGVNTANANFSLRFAVDGEGNSALTEIGRGAFAFSALRSIVIPSGVTSIGAQAFMSCASLARVTIGSAEKQSSLASFGQLCFTECKALSELTMYVPGVVEMELYNGSTAEDKRDIFYSASEDFTIRVPSAAVDAFKEAENWSAYAERISAAE